MEYPLNIWQLLTAVTGEIGYRAARQCYRGGRSQLTINQHVRYHRIPKRATDNHDAVLLLIDRQFTIRLSQ
jgi:hypothetical protein